MTNRLIPVYSGDQAEFIGSTDPAAAAPPGIPAVFIVGYRGAGRIQTSSYDVTSSASIIVGENARRRTVTIQNLGANDVYIGGEDVTTVNGYKVSANTALTLELSGELWAVTESTTENVRTITELDI